MKRGPGLCLAVLLAAAGLVGCGSSGDSNLNGSEADRALLKATVHSAALSLGALAVSRAVDQDVIRTYVHSVTFLDDNSGYFFAYDDTDNTCVAHWKNRDWEGTVKSDYQDSRGTFVIQELSKIAKADGKGFLVYYWLNPTTNLEERKLGYIELIPGTTIYIGSGIYVE